MLEIYENIKKYRKMNKWTQEELAKKWGMETAPLFQE